MLFLEDEGEKPSVLQALPSGKEASARLWHMAPPNMKAQPQLKGVRDHRSPSSSHTIRFCSWKMRSRTTFTSSSAWHQDWASTQAHE